MSRWAPVIVVRSRNEPAGPVKVPTAIRSSSRRSLGQVTLFDRNGSPLVLTEHGAALRGPARGILEAVQAARDEVAAISGLVRGTVTLGSTLHTGPLDLACVLADIRERHPDVVVKLRQSRAGSEGLLQELREGAVDVALTATPPGTGPGRGIEVRELFSEPLVFACRQDHALSHRAVVAVPDLHAERILRSPPGWGTRAVVDAALGATKSAFEIVDYGLMARLVRDGFATTLVPASAFSGGMLDGLCLIRVDDARLHWTLSAAICTDRRMTAATTALLSALIQRSGLPQRKAPAVLAV